MSELWHLSRDCREVCAPGRPAACDDPQCCCECHTDPGPLCQCEVRGGPGQCVGASCMREVRARELDDRPDVALANVARDVEAEKQAGLEELRRERFGLHGWPRRGAA